MTVTVGRTHGSVFLSTSNLDRTIPCKSVLQCLRGVDQKRPFLLNVYPLDLPRWKVLSCLVSFFPHSENEFTWKHRKAPSFFLQLWLVLGGKVDRNQLSATCFTGQLVIVSFTSVCILGRPCRSSKTESIHTRWATMAVINGVSYNL